MCQVLAVLLPPLVSTLCGRNPPPPSQFANLTLTFVLLQINKLSATAEVMQGLYLIIELVLPTRNFLFIYLWYNYLTMRHMQDKNGCLKEAVGALDMQIMNLLSHR